MWTHREKKRCFLVIFLFLRIRRIKVLKKRKKIRK